MTDLTPGSRGLGRLGGCCAVSAAGAAGADEEEEEAEEEEEEEEAAADDAFRLVPSWVVVEPSSFGGGPHPATSLCARSRALSLTNLIYSEDSEVVNKLAATHLPQAGDGEGHDRGGGGWRVHRRAPDEALGRVRVAVGATQKAAAQPSLPALGVRRARSVLGQCTH